jgi:plasmid stabilization system protein ParE
MKVALSPAAEADLDRIGEWIAKDNPARAVTFLVDLRACCERLADAPRGYPLVPRFERVGIRRRAYKNYLIFYVIRGDTIEVLHVVHGARDYERLLSRQEGEG